MKIAIEAQRLFRAKKHGMDIVALEMIKNLQDLDKVNEYHVFVKNDIDSKCIELKNNFHLHILPSVPYPIWEQFVLPKAVAKCGVDLLHCTSNTAPLFVKCATVITVHDIIYLENNLQFKGSAYQRFGNIYRRFIVPPAIKNAKTIVTVSNFELETIQNKLNLPTNKIKVVYNGVGSHFNNQYTKEAQEKVKKQYNLPDNFILFLGNTAPKKNLENVIKAYADYISKNENPAKLVIVDYSAENLIGMLKAKGLPDLLNEGKIVLAGYVKNVDLPIFYCLSKLFLYPSLRESFGIPILEAMACGTPVITSNTSSMPEVAGTAALLVDPFTYKSISELITKVLQDENIQATLRSKGLQRALEFTWKNTAANMLKIYQARN